MLFDYDRKREVSLTRVWFDYLGGRHEGRGVMLWDPLAGFHIHANVKRSGSELPQTIEFPWLTTRPDALARVWVEADGFGLGCTGPVSLGGSLALLLQERLSLKVRRMVFSRAFGHSRLALTRDPDSVMGDALLESAEDLILPDSLSQETRLGDRMVSVKDSAEGLSSREQDFTLTMTAKGRRLTLDYVGRRPAWTARRVWRVPMAAALAIAVGSRGECSVLVRRLEAGGRECIEIAVPSEPSKLGILAPFFDSSVLDKSRFMTMLRFLSTDSPEGVVCERMYYQITEAARQTTWQATELLLSTILEAALRTLLDKPFQPKGRGINLRQELGEFRKRYLAAEWEPHCDRATEIHGILRHRNAHPDWLAAPLGPRARLVPPPAVDHAIFLSRFYGYMMLALAGHQPLEPRFPTPHKDWKPIMSVSTAPEDRPDTLETDAIET